MMLVLYDGVCGLCNGLVQLILPRDRRGVFVFAALQSPAARNVLTSLGLCGDDLATLYVVERYGGQNPLPLTKSRAALAIARGLGWWWFAPLRVVPRWFADRVYDFVAKRRYRWFGRYESCPIPEPRHRGRFLDAER